MRKFWVNSIIAVLLLSLFTGCVSSDINFGNDLVYTGNKMVTFNDTLDILKTYQCAMDSFPGSASGSGAIGVWRSDSTGTCRASMVTNYVPMGFEDDSFFGDGAEIDSLKLTTVFGTVDGWGDSTVSMSISVYRINGFVFNKDSTYYTNFPIEKYIDPTPLCTFTTNEAAGDSSITVHLPKWYAKMHLDNRQDTTNIYVRDDKFTNRINGLYFTAETVNPNDRRILDLELGSCSLRLYYHNSEYSDTALCQSFIFYNTSLSSYCLDFQVMKQDYTTAKPAYGGVDYRVIGDTLEAQERTYITSPSGLYTRIDFDTTFLRKLKADAKELGYNNIGVLHASLRLKPAYTDYITMNKQFEGLKLYLDIQKPMFLTEYNPILSSSSSAYNTVGGTFVRSTGYYEFDITGYVQRLVSGATQKTHLDIYPAYSSGLSWGTTFLGGSEDPKCKPELIVTYSMLQQK